MFFLNNFFFLRLYKYFGITKNKIVSSKGETLKRHGSILLHNVYENCMYLYTFFNKPLTSNNFSVEFSVLSLDLNFLNCYFFK